MYFQHFDSDLMETAMLEDKQTMESRFAHPSFFPTMEPCAAINVGKTSTTNRPSRVR